jgi:hypothetical protein
MGAGLNHIGIGLINSRMQSPAEACPAERAVIFKMNFEQEEKT